MNELQVFNFESNEVRTQVVNDEPHFMLTDVCKVLDIKNVSDAKSRLKKDGVVTTDTIDKLGRTQNANFINESNLYKVIFQSRKPNAEKFTDWVTSEVLPSIRKHGAYMTPEKIEEALLNPDTLIQLATNLKDERTKRLVAEQQVMELKPKADYYDNILLNKGLVTISTIAKNYGYSAGKFNDLLHELGIQYKQGKTWLLYQKHATSGYTHSEPFGYKDKEGKDQVTMNTKWTTKGHIFLYQQLKKNKILPMIEQIETEA